jgi:hypothetical protein
MGENIRWLIHVWRNSCGLKSSIKYEWWEFKNENRNIRYGGLKMASVS